MLLHQHLRILQTTLEEQGILKDGEANPIMISCVSFFHFLAPISYKFANKPEPIEYWSIVAALFYLLTVFVSFHDYLLVLSPGSVDMIIGTKLFRIYLFIFQKVPFFYLLDFKTHVTMIQNMSKGDIISGTFWFQEENEGFGLSSYLGIPTLIDDWDHSLSLSLLTCVSIPSLHVQVSSRPLVRGLSPNVCGHSNGSQRPSPLRWGTKKKNNTLRTRRSNPMELSKCMSFCSEKCCIIHYPW